jgi:RNA-directed DNA polymerase
MIEKVLNKRNLQRAYAQVVRNGGSAGVDGVSVHDLRMHLREHWPALALDVVHQRYLPLPIKGVEITVKRGS